MSPNAVDLLSLSLIDKAFVVLVAAAIPLLTAFGHWAKIIKMAGDEYLEYRTWKVGFLKRLEEIRQQERAIRPS